MAYLIGSASTARFASTTTYNSGAGLNTALFNGNDTQGLTPASAGTAVTLSLYVSSWGSVTSVKAALYADNALVETVVLTSALGTGVVPIALSGTTTIDITKKYRLALFTGQNADLTLFADAAALTKRISTSAGTFTSPGATLPAGSFSTTHEFYWAVQSASGPTVTSITDPIIGTDAVTIVLSEAAPTVDTINFTVGSVTQSQSYITGDDTTFTISTVTRNLLPPIGTVTVELKAGATVIATTTATLQQPAGYDAVTGSGVDDALAAPHTGFLSDGDIAEVSDVGNTVLDPAFTNFAQIIPGPFTVRVWDASEELWGVSSFFTVEGGEGSTVIGSIINSVIIQSIIS